jgi:calcium-dependent protein kinase
MPEDACLISKSEISKTVHLESKTQPDIRLHYRFIDVIGHGSFGIVRKAVAIHHQSSRPHQVAIKSVPKTLIKKDISVLMRELETLQIVDHPNVIRLYATYEDEKYLHLVMELCTGGDLMERIVTQGVYSEATAASVMHKLCSGVFHLHSSFICHRDIKVENILFTDKHSSEEVKIIDFGMACKFGETPLHSRVGTPYYMSPEVVHGSYSKECDVWSLGVVLFVMLSGTQPFEGNELNLVLGKIVKGKYSFEDEVWSDISASAKRLISSMLVVRPLMRLSLSEVLEHAWFRETIRPTPVQVPISVLNSLKRHRAGNRLYAETAKIIVNRLNSSEINDLRDIFRSLDVEMTGYITADGLQTALEQRGLTLAHGEIQSKLYAEIIMANDYLGEGRIKYTDFLIATLDFKQILDDEIIWGAFSFFDTDRDGCITTSEIEGALIRAGCELSQEELNEVFEAFDLNSDRYIDFEEFKEMLKSFVECPSNDLMSSPISNVHFEHETAAKRKTLSRPTLYQGMGEESDRLTSIRRLTSPPSETSTNFYRSQVARKTAGSVLTSNI